MKRRQRIYWWTLGIWLAAVFVHFGWYLAESNRQPATDEVYAQMLWFQVAAFVATKMPYWLVGLLILLFGEFVAFGRARRDEQFGQR